MSTSGQLHRLGLLYSPGPELSKSCHTLLQLQSPQEKKLARQGKMAQIAATAKGLPQPCSGAAFDGGHQGCRIAHVAIVHQGLLT